MKNRIGVGSSTSRLWATALLVLAPALAPAQVDPNGSIESDQWLALGPFSSDLGCTGRDDALLTHHIAPDRPHCQFPRDGDEVDYDPELSQTSAYHGPWGPSGKPVWRVFQDHRVDDYVDMEVDAARIGAPTDLVMTMVATYFEYLGPEPIEAELCLGSDDGMQVLLDTSLVHSINACRGRVHCDDLVPVTITPGPHRLLMLVWENTGGFGGSVAIRVDGNPVSALDPDWLFLGTDPDGFSPPCASPPERVVTTAPTANPCLVGTEPPIRVALSQLGGDPDEIVTVRERVLAAIDSSGVETTPPASVTDLPLSPVGLFADHRDVGAHPTCEGPLGSTTEGPEGVYTLTARGGDFGPEGDRLHFAYVRVTGDFRLEVRIRSRRAAPGSRHAKPGILVREGLDPSARSTLVYDPLGDVASDPSGNDESTRWLGRSTTGGGDLLWSTPLPQDPDPSADDYCDGEGPDDGACTIEHHDYLAIDRSQDRIYCYSRASPGDEWRFLGRHDWGGDAPATVLVGLAAASGSSDCDAEVEVVFDEVRFERGGPDEILVGAGVEIEWSVPRSLLASGGVTYALSPAPGLIGFDGRVAGERVWGPSPHDLGEPPERDHGPFADPPFEHAHGIGWACPRTSIESRAPGTLTISGAGNDFGGTADHGQFAYSEVRGDFSARVRILERPPEGPHLRGRFGIMARQDCRGRSRYSFVRDSQEWPDYSVKLETREATGQATHSVQGLFPQSTHADVLRLDRCGSRFRGYVLDEEGLLGPPGRWVLLGESDWGPTAPGSVFLGLAVTSDNFCDTATVITFSEWEVEPLCREPVRAVSCAHDGERLRISWESPEFGAPDGPISIRVDGARALELPPDATSAELPLPEAPGEELNALTVLVSVVNASGIAADCLHIEPDGPWFEEFVGPFPSWLDARSDLGAVGDGIADDTAALQAGLDLLRAEHSEHDVLYLPAGTYRVTDTLRLPHQTHYEATGTTIVGEDPQATAIVWDGPRGPSILEYGGWYSKIGRLTLDGRGRAGAAVEFSPAYSTGDEFTDLVIRDVDFGIRAGMEQGIDTVAVARCRLLRCRTAGISIQTWNSLNWWIRDSLFVECGQALTNLYRAGHYFAFDCVFVRSTQVDFRIGNTLNFSMRHNTSVASGAHFHASTMTAGGPFTLQGDRVLRPLARFPLYCGTLGPMLLLDNEFRTRFPGQPEPIFSAGSWWEGDYIFIDNTFSSPVHDNENGDFLRIGSRDVSPEAIELTVPDLPDTPPRRGPGAGDVAIFEVPRGATAVEIQRAIDEAAELTGQRPVVHLPGGTYAIDRTLVIPAGCDVQLVGDGILEATQLNWNGAGPGPLLRLEGPSRATLRDFGIDGATKVDGIVVEDCDQPGGRVHLDQLWIWEGSESGLLVDGLEMTRVVAHAMDHHSNATSIRVLGDPDWSPPAPTVSGGLVEIHGGNSGGHLLAYDVDHGGRLLVRDMWYEENVSGAGRFLRLRGSGEFTLHGGLVAMSGRETEPVIDIDDFDGRVALITTIIASISASDPIIRVRGEGTGTEALLLGCLIKDREGDFDRLVVDSPRARVGMVGCRYERDHAYEVPDVGESDPEFLARLIATTRESRPGPLTPVPAGATDVRLFRVFSRRGPVCVRLEAGERDTPPPLPRFRRGDANDDGSVDLSDAVYTLNHLFLGGRAPTCAEAANANDDGSVDLSDAVYTLNHLFLGGSPPPPPGPDGAACGPDPVDSPSALGCEAFTSCDPP